MNAWGKSLDADKSSGIRFLGDADGSFTRALDVEFDSAAILGNNRSKRYALVVKDGKITDVNIEPDNVGVSGECITPRLRGGYSRTCIDLPRAVSGADKVLG
jgi:peroxiredoxin